MTGHASLRERKKAQTRSALIKVAIELFEQQGYAGTTVAEIAERANVSPRTFFSYFESKDDVLFADTSEQLGVMLRIFSARKADSVKAVLEQAVEAIMDAPGWELGPDSDLLPKRVRLILSTPELQAQALYRLALVEAQLAEGLRLAFPAAVDAVSAAAAIGALLGAVRAVALYELGRGATAAQLRTSVQRATRLVVQDLG